MTGKNFVYLNLHVHTYTLSELLMTVAEVEPLDAMIEASFSYGHNRKLRQLHIYIRMYKYCPNAMSHSLDNTLLVAHSNSTFTISSLQACSSKVALHLVYNKTFIKQGYLT